MWTRRNPFGARAAFGAGSDHGIVPTAEFDRKSFHDALDACSLKGAFVSRSVVLPRIEFTRTYVACFLRRVHVTLLAVCFAVLVGFRPFGAIGGSFLVKNERK